jgi:Dolichyl-phosphate-mannose-protein mannosyltransferase
MPMLSAPKPTRLHGEKPHADSWILGGLGAAISISALLFYFRRGAILLYGDAVAHANIARHIFDSRTPGVLEFGTVWLPLPHLLDIPFVANHWMWQSGIGASIPSMLAYVAGVIGIFRLVRGWASRFAAWSAALIYALNPNLIYMQATAMTEPLYLALFVWATVHFSEFVRTATNDSQRARRSLELSGVMISAATLVRYDGWFLAACAMAALAVMLWRLRLRGLLAPAILRSALNFVLLPVLSMGLWLAYNHGAYGRALEFAVGPYSSRAIADGARTAGFPSYPGEHSLWVSALYFLKAAGLDVGEARLGRWMLGFAFAALLAAVCFSQKHLPLALLWVPAAFYSLSIAHGSVPIYFPHWWPYSYYNVRYGLQLLPAIAVFAALAAELASRLVPLRLAVGALLLLAAASYIVVWRYTPICLREAEANGAARLAFDTKLGDRLKKLQSGATLMMYCGEHPGAIQASGIPFRRVLREGNHPDWEIGLSDPAQAADYLVAITGDDMALAIRLFPRGLVLVDTMDAPGRRKAFLYRSMR